VPLPSLVGSTVSHYEILDVLGEGGMGVVYKALDRNLDRVVALKVLKTGAVESPEELRQFEREAKTISSLNHPHIATIHDRGEVDGKHYLVFEFLSGGTLKAKLAERTAREEPFTIDEVVRYVTEAGQGLAHAHRQGVIHRDIKTENLMLTADGSVKVTDFGLAQWNTVGSTTSGHGASGTAAYMSPEQAQGLAIDERSDIFSFGLVLYELLTGETAFQGLYMAAVVYDIINSPTPSVLDKRPDTPEHLCRVVERATAKSPDDRYRSMDEFFADLTGSGNRGAAGGNAEKAQPAAAPYRRLRLIGGLAAVIVLAAIFLIPWPIREARNQVGTAVQSGAPEPISIAVLPLENLSRDPAKDYLADGLTEALITDLAKRPRFRVISRTSVMRYKGARKALPEIAKELNVERIVEGTILQVGDEVRITAQLINAPKDEHIWAESYRSSMADVLGLQQEMSAAIAGEIDTRLRAQVAPGGGATRHVNPQAYEAYLRGREQSFQWTLASVERGIAEFKRAIEIDPNYGAAHAGLAMAYGFLCMNGGAPPNEAWTLARVSAEKALGIDPTLDSAYTSLGFVQTMYDWNWDSAEKHFQRALSLNPSSVNAMHAYGMTLLAPLGRFDEALEMMRSAQRLDPLSSAVNNSLGDVYYFRREYDKAIRQYEKTLELDPDFGNSYMSLGFTYLAQGKRQVAKEAFEHANAVPNEATPLTMALVGALSEDTTAARTFLSGMDRAVDMQYVFACQVAMLHLALDEREQSLDWLERAYRQRASSVTFLNVNPFFDSIRDEPRFQAVVEKMNL